MFLFSRFTVLGQTELPAMPLISVIVVSLICEMHPDSLNINSAELAEFCNASVTRSGFS